jgi:aspartate carbamoyltransferase catalytic subunit
LGNLKDLGENIQKGIHTYLKSGRTIMMGSERRKKKTSIEKNSVNESVDVVVFYRVKKERICDSENLRLCCYFVCKRLSEVERLAATKLFAVVVVCVVWLCEENNKFEEMHCIMLMFMIYVH